jgi:phosphoglycerate dehydrogenase-like enzyme
MADGESVSFLSGPDDRDAGHSSGSDQTTFLSLRSAIEKQTARVGIIGLGYVGLPLARAFADKGFTVLLRHRCPQS